MSAHLATGTSLNVGPLTSTDPTPGAEDFTRIAEIQSISGPGQTKSAQEVTPLDATARRYLNDLPTQETLDFTIYFDGADTQHAQIIADAAAVDVERWWRIDVSDGSTFQFAGEVSSFTPSFEQGSPITASVQVQVSGGQTFTPPA